MLECRHCRHAAAEERHRHHTAIPRHNMQTDSMTTPACTCSCGASSSASGGGRGSSSSAALQSPSSSGRAAAQVNPYGSSRTTSTNNSNNLDASFVYLPPAPSSASGAGDILLYQIESSLQHGGDADGGLAIAARHTAHLADMIVEGRYKLDGGDDGNNRNDVCLCRACLERVTRAIDADAERYEQETKAYMDAVTSEEDRERQIRQTLSLNAEVAAAGAVDGNNDIATDLKCMSGDELVKNAALNFESEVATLEAAVKEYEQELHHLDELMREQVQRAGILSREEDLVFMDQNDIEIDANEFENVCQQLTARCNEAHKEAVALSKVNLHSALFDIVVSDDCQGTNIHSGSQTPSYSRINGMRLAHRPRFDLGWAEINCAWASAAQLLLFIGSSIKFTSEDLRIVPMSSCAKIMEIRSSKKYVHNLGIDLDQKDVRNGSSSSNGTHHTSRLGDHLIMVPAIRAFNALLSQMMEHLLKQKKASREAQPFKMSRTTIGSYDLMRLHEEDGPSASSVIFCIAKNLKWLAHNSSLDAPTNK